MCRTRACLSVSVDLARAMLEGGFEDSYTLRDMCPTLHQHPPSAYGLTMPHRQCTNDSSGFVSYPGIDMLARCGRLRRRVHWAQCIKPRLLL